MFPILIGGNFDFGPAASPLLEATDLVAAGVSDVDEICAKEENENAIIAATRARDLMIFTLEINRIYEKKTDDPCSDND
jgi:hypothetical protein